MPPLLPRLVAVVPVLLLLLTASPRSSADWVSGATGTTTPGPDHRPADAPQNDPAAPQFPDVNGVASTDDETALAPRTPAGPFPETVDEPTPSARSFCEVEWEPLVTLIATPDVRKLPRGVRDDKPHAPPLEKADLPPDLLARRPVAWTGGRRIELTTLDIVVTVVVLAVGVRALLTLIPSALPGKESSAAG